jgi:hypothetical protein
MAAEMGEAYEDEPVTWRLPYCLFPIYFRNKTRLQGHRVAVGSAECYGKKLGVVGGEDVVKLIMPRCSRDDERKLEF